MLDLPIDRARPVVPSGHGLHVPFTFSSELQDKLNALSQESGTTLFMTLLAAFQVLLARYSGQTDIAVGSPIANRSHTEIEGLIGFFVNMLVLRSNLSENPTFAQILNQVWETTLQAFAHQDLPFERIVEELQPDRDLSINPLYQVSFSLQNTPLAQLDLPGITFQPIVSLEATTKVDLELHMWESPEGLQGTLIYNMDLFVPSTIENLIEHFQILLEGICSDPNSEIGSLPLLTETTYQTLSAWSEAKTEYPVTTLVQEYVEQQAARHPDALAVWCDGRELSYAQLNGKANQLAYFLRTQAVGPEIIVGICMQRTCELYIAMLAILKAGGAYLPIDPAYPGDRIAYMLQDAHVALLLTQQSLIDNLAGLVSQTLALDAGWSELEDLSQENLPQLASADNLAYVIYTSGSTGRPKGVQITQANLLESYSMASADLSSGSAGAGNAASGCGL